MVKIACVLLLSAVCCTGFANPIVYNVNLSIGGGSVTGFIETDGTVGVLHAGNVLDWNLVLNQGATFDLLGPLSGPNSQIGVSGSSWSATASQLLFDYSGSGFVLFQAPTLFTGSNFWCMQASPCSGTVGTGDVLNVAGGVGGGDFGNSFTAQTGIHAVAHVPEPVSLALLGLGLAGLAVTRSRKLT